MKSLDQCDQTLSKYDSGPAVLMAGRDAVHHAKDLLATIKWMAQTFHQAHHGLDAPTTWRQCPKNTCDAARQAFEKTQVVETK